MTEPTVEARHRLREEPAVWCATVRPDGSPHVTPVWFVFEVGTWWIATPRRSVKVANLELQDHVSLALPDPDRPLVAQGRARIVYADFPCAVTMAFAKKYDGWDITSDEPDGPRVLLQVETDRWLLPG